MKDLFLLSRYLSFVILLPLACQVYFTEEPVDVTAKEGALMVTIDCQIANLDRTSQIVAFERGSCIISDDARIRVDVSSRYTIQLRTHTGTMRRSYSLTIALPTRNDTGRYRCVICARNASTGGCDDDRILAESGKAKLTVNFHPADFYPICTPPPLPVSRINGSVMELVEGETVNLTCCSEIASPPVSLTWFKNGVEVTDQVKTWDANSIRYSRLKVTPVKEDNGTVFTCAITSEPHKDMARNCSLSPLDVTTQGSDSGSPDANHGDDRASIIIIVILAVIILVLLVAIAVAVFLKRKNGSDFNDRGIEYQPAETVDAGETKRQRED